MTIDKIKSLRDQFSEDYSALLITNLKNINYLCGFSGSSAMLLITKTSAWFFTDFRYEEQSAREVSDHVKTIIADRNLGVAVCKKLKSLKVAALGIEMDMSVGQYLFFTENFDGKVVPAQNLVEQLRQIKSADEIKTLKKAFEIADDAFAQLIKIIKPGMTEIEAAAHLEFFMKNGGSKEPSFGTILASGPNSSSPHAQPGTRKLKKGEMVKIDFGAVYDGFHSDMTRTIFLGKATEKFRKIYEIVLKAQTEAIKKIKPGVKCSYIDKVARDVIDEAGYKENFGHGLGHSLGLDVHEMPSLSSKCDTIIKAGMLFTVEPGIYLPGWGGIRIEDAYAVKEKGLTRMTNTPNDLLELKF